MILKSNIQEQALEIYIGSQNIYRKHDYFENEDRILAKQYGYFTSSLDI